MGTSALRRATGIGAAAAIQPAPQVPGAWARRVLFTVCGLSPQVITESIYALAVAAADEQRFVPTEVHVLTTLEGARRVRSTLLEPHSGGFHRLLQDYNLPAMKFADIHLVEGADGKPLADIRSDADNACMADKVTALVRQFTADAHCALHVSIAGGRKTMGYYAGYALSLLGRDQDRLSHVLVSAPFESSLEFFYPTPHPQKITIRGEPEPADAATAEVTLAQIPFVRLRPILPVDMRDSAASFAAVVQAADQRLGPHRLVLDIRKRRIDADGITIPLAPWPFALMAVMAHRALTNAPALGPPNVKDGHDAVWAAAFKADLIAAMGQMHLPEQVLKTLDLATCGNTLSPHWSRLRKRLQERLGPRRTSLYFLSGSPRQRAYCIPLGPQAIEFRR